MVENTTVLPCRDGIEACLVPDPWPKPKVFPTKDLGPNAQGSFDRNAGMPAVGDDGHAGR